MRGQVLKQNGQDAEIEVTDIAEQQNYMVPWDAKWGDVPASASGDTVEELAELAQIQTRKHKREFPLPGIDGKLIIAELTRDRVSMYTHCELSAAQS